MLARIDTVGLPCYLETENATNISIYQRYGFQVVADDAVPDGPHIWAIAADLTRPHPQPLSHGERGARTVCSRGSVCLLPLSL